MMLLTVQLATPIVRLHTTGTGYDVFTAFDGHDVKLQIGNVSIVFDGRNVFDCFDDYEGLGVVMQFSEYRDCPVRLNDTPYGIPDETLGIAERIMFALAADLGYYIQPNGPRE